MSVKIQARLPDDDRDGLQVLAERFRTTGDRTAPAIVVCRVYLDRIETRLHDDKDPVRFVLAVESLEVMDDSDASFAEACMRQRFESRTGQAPLPFGMITDTDTADDPED